MFDKKTLKTNQDLMSSFFKTAGLPEVTLPTESQLEQILATVYGEASEAELEKIFKMNELQVSIGSERLAHFQQRAIKEFEIFFSKQIK